MNSAERTTRSRPSAGNRKQPGPFRRLLTCCIAGTANREDLDDAYEPDAQSTPPARVEPSNAASERKVFINSTLVDSSDPRGSAAPAGQQALLNSTPVQQLQTGTGQHDARDAVSSEPRMFEQKHSVATSSDAAGTKGQPASYTVEGPSDLHAVRTDQQQQYPAAPADAAATDGTPVPVLSQVGPVSALSLESSLDGPNAPAAHLQQQQHQPGTLLQHQQQEPFAANATAGFMQGPHGPHALQQHPASLPAMQYRHPFLLDPIAESPRQPGESPMAGQARPPGGSPREPQVSLAQGLADSDIHLAPEPAAATAAAGDAVPVMAGDTTAGGGPAAAAAAAAADAAASNRVESPRQPQVSLAQGLADADIHLQPEPAAAAAAAAAIAAGTLELQPPAAPAAAEGQSALADEHSTARTAVTAEPAEAATQPKLVSPAAVSAVAGDSSGLTPPASPRSALATPFTQPKAQALVAQELLVHKSRGRQAIGSRSSSSSGQPGSQQQQQQGNTQDVGGIGASSAARAAAATGGASGSSSAQPGTLPSQQQQQQQQVERKPQRRPLSEEVEEAVVTQIRPARSTSLTTGADPSRVWALVAQFDGSKQHAAHTPAIPANVAVTVPAGGGGAAITAATHMRRGADAASPAAAAAAAAFGGTNGVGANETAAVESGAAGTSPQRLHSPGNAAVQPPSAEEIYAAFSTKRSGGSPARRLSPTVSAARAEGGSSKGSPHGIQLAPHRMQQQQQQQQQQQSPPTSPHSTGWSEDDAADVPLGLRKIKVGKGKAPKAEAAYSESHSSSNLFSGSSASSAAAKLQSPGAAAGAAAANEQQQQLSGGLASDTGADSFIPHFTAVTGPGSSNRHRSPSPGSGVQGSRAAGLPPRPRSSKDLADLAGGIGSASNSGSNSAGWATGVSSSANTSGSKYYSAHGLHIRTGVTGAGTAAAGTAAAGQYNGDQPDNVFTGLQLGGTDSLGPFVRTQEQQQQVIGGGSSSEGEGEGGGGVSGKDWEVLPVMPLSPLRVPRNKVEDLLQFEDTPPTPRTSVVGVSNSIIDHMLSEEGIPLVPTSGVDEYAGVHGLDSPFFSGPAIFGRSVSGSRAQGLAGVSSWGGGGATTPRFSHSSSFSAYGMGAHRGLAGGSRASYSGSFAGVAGVGGRQRSAGARGRGRVRRLSTGNDDLNDAATSSWQQFQQQRGIRSFDVPTGGGRVGRLSDAGSSAAGAAAGSAAIGDRVGGGGDDAPVTPRGSYGSTAATSFFSSDSKPDQGLEGPMGIVPSQQQVVPVLPVSSTALPVHSSTHVSPSAARNSMLLGTPAAASMAAAGAAGGVGPSPSDTASVRSPVSSPISQLAERASAVATAVAAAAAAGASGDIAAGSSKLQTSVTSGSTNSLNSGSQNSSAAFATSASNLPSDAALFSRSGWASLHPHQQQQQQHHHHHQLMGQWSVSRRDGGREHGPTSLFETPKDPRPRAEATAVLPSLATALEKQ